jgi:hypothetical protein
VADPGRYSLEEQHNADFGGIEGEDVEDIACVVELR